jgi:hypothetical protein
MSELNLKDREGWQREWLELLILTPLFAFLEYAGAEYQ